MGPSTVLKVSRFLVLPNLTFQNFGHTDLNFWIWILTVNLTVGEVWSASYTHVSHIYVMLRWWGIHREFICDDVWGWQLHGGSYKTVNLNLNVTGKSEYGWRVRCGEVPHIPMYHDVSLVSYINVMLRWWGIDLWWCLRLAVTWWQLVWIWMLLVSLSMGGGWSASHTHVSYINVMLRWWGIDLWSVSK